MRFSQKNSKSRLITTNELEPSRNLEQLIQITPRDFESERLNYELKIREQNQTLYEMHEYVMLCEERIKQLCPDHELPVTEKHLKSPLKGLQVERLRKENETLKSSCVEKDKMNTELRNLNNNFHILSNDSLKVKNLRNDFPNHDKIPSDKIREVYSHLLVTFRKLVIEKEQIVESLRTETLINEEQKNYIAILQHTLEIKINKLGLSNVIANQKKLYYKDTTSNMQVILDVIDLKSENENLRKELILSQLLASELKNDNEKLKEEIEENAKGKSDVCEELRINLGELEKRKDQNMKNEETIEKFKRENEKMMSERQSFMSKIKQLEKEMLEISISNFEHHNKANDMNFNKTKVIELKQHNDDLKEKNEELNRDNEKLNIEYKTLSNKTKSKLEEIRILENKLKENSEKYESNNRTLMSENIKISQQLKSLERNLEEKDILIKEKDSKIFELSKRCENVDKMFNELKITSDNSFNEWIETKNLFDKKVQKLEFIIKELNQTIEKYKEKLEHSTKDKEKLEDLNHTYINNIRSFERGKIDSDEELRFAEEKYEKLSNTYEDLIRTNKSNEKEKRELLTQLNNLREEVKLNKENYEKESVKKNTEIKELLLKLETDNIEIQMLKEKIISQKELIVKLEFQNDNKDRCLKEKEKHLNQYIQEDIENLKTTEELLLANRKNDNLLEQTLSQQEEINKLKHMNEECNTKIGLFLSEKTDLELDLNHHKEGSKKMMIEIKLLGDNIKEYKENNESLIKELNKNKEIINNLESYILTLKSEIEVFKDKHYEIYEEREEINGENKRLNAELEYLKRSSKENCNHLLQMQNTLNEIKQSLSSCVCVAKIFICKFNVNSLEESLISKNFSENLSKLYKEIHCLENDKAFNSSIRILEEFIRIISVELETSLQEKTNHNKDLEKCQRIIGNLEQKIKLYETHLERLKNNEKSLEEKLNDKKESFKDTNRSLESLNSKYERSVKDAKTMETKYKKLLEDNRSLSEEITKLTENNLNFQREMKEIIYEKNKISNNYDCLSEINNLLYKERKNYDDVLNFFCKAISSKNISGVFSEIINNLETVFKMEIDKLKLTHKLKEMERETKTDNSLNSTLLTSMYNEISNIKNFLIDFEKKIIDKRNYQSFLTEKFLEYDSIDQLKNNKLTAKEESFRKKNESKTSFNCFINRIDNINHNKLDNSDPINIKNEKSTVSIEESFSEKEPK